MEALRSLLQPFGGSSMLDGVKLVVLGGAVETARRASSSAWSSFVNSFYLTTHLTEEDYPYDWVLNWLEKQPAWSRSREFETTTRNATVGGALNKGGAGGDEVEEPEDDEEEDELVPGKQRLKVLFTPTYDTTHTIFYKGHWLRVKRSKKSDGSDVEMLTISVVARNNSILKQLVLQAKREYEADAIHRIQIYFADSHGSWRWTDSRHKRPISSIILNPGVTEMLLADTRDFLKSEKWYADRGIPFRRGYLLYGVPGAGKTSLIHAIAGELQLDIYCLSLSSSWISDSTLTTLMGRVPARCILLLEDLDAAFTRSVTRDSGSTGSPKDKDDSNSGAMSDVNSLSLSGLLNALDGVAASEGRLLFATTNHLDRLDPALSRPGRMDVWIEFKNASKWQAEGLFRNFFPCVEEEPGKDAERELTAEEEAELGSFNFPQPPPSQSPPLRERAASATASLSRATAKSSGLHPRSLSSSSLSKASTSSSLSKASTSSSLSKATGSSLSSTSYQPPSSAPIAGHSAPPMDAAKLARLAKQFADSIPEDEFSVAALQGYLLKNKSRPEAAASEAGGWVISERELREKLRKEKEAKEKKEREEREKRRREREEKEKEEKEKARKEKEEKEEKEKEKKEKERKEKEKEDAKADAEEKVKAAEEKAKAAEERAKAAEEKVKAEATTATTKGTTAKGSEATSLEASTTLEAEGESESGNEETKKEAWVAVKKDEE